MLREPSGSHLSRSLRIERDGDFSGGVPAQPPITIMPTSSRSRSDSASPRSSKRSKVSASVTSSSLPPILHTVTTYVRSEASGSDVKVKRKFYRSLQNKFTTQEFGKGPKTKTKTIGVGDTVACAVAEDVYVDSYSIQSSPVDGSEKVMFTRAPRPPLSNLLSSLVPASTTTTTLPLFPFSPTRSLAADPLHATTTKMAGSFRKRGWERDPPLVLGSL